MGSNTVFNGMGGKTPRQEPKTQNNNNLCRKNKCEKDQFDQFDPIWIWLLSCAKVYSLSLNAICLRARAWESHYRTMENYHIIVFLDDSAKCLYDVCVCVRDDAACVWGTC